MINYHMNRLITHCLWFGLLISTLPLSAQLGLTLVGNKDYSPRLNDIWGYTDPNGREYALVGLTTGVSIVDLIDPSQPTEIHFIPGAFSVWRDLKTSGHHAYVSNESDFGTLIIDLSGLPGSIAWKDTLLAGVKTAHNVWVENDQLYLSGTNNFNGGIARFSLADPWHPTFAGAYTQRYVHDVYVRNDTAYSAEISDGLLTVIDWTVPLSPVVLSTTDYLNSFTHNTWLNDGGDVCFTTDELPGAFVYAWDVSDPINPRLLDGIRSSLSNGEAIPHNVHVKDDYLVTSYYRDGLHITDASRPHNLVEVGYFDTSPLEAGGFNGAWGAYPYLPSGLILVSDIEGGLFVIQPSYQRGCYLEGKVRDAATQAPIANVEVTLVGHFEDDRTRTNGDYALGHAQAGNYQVIFARYGYLPDTQNVIITNGQVTALDVDLVPISRIPIQVIVKDANTLQPIPNAQVRLITYPEKEVEFTYSTISNGVAQDPYFVINSYIVIAGKWGYRNDADTLVLDSSNYQLEFLLQPGYYDDFSLDLGWEVEGTAERGMWVRGEPIGTYRENGDIYNPEYDLPFDIGDECYMTGNAGGDAVFDDVDNGYTLLISPPMDLSGYKEPTIQYYWWFLNWSLLDGGRPGNDFFSVSITDGLDTFEIKRYEGPYDTLWNHETNFYFQKYFPDLQRPFRILFYTQDFEPGNQDQVEAALDGFEVVESAITRLDHSSMEGKLQVLPGSPGQLPIRWEGMPQGVVLLVRDPQGRQLFSHPLDFPQGEKVLQLPLASGLYLLTWELHGRQLGWKKWIASE